MTVGGCEVWVSFVEVACEAWHGVQGLTAQPAGEGGSVHQGSVGLQTGHRLESSMTNLGRGEVKWGEGWEAVGEDHLPRTAGLRTLGCCCCCSRGGRWSRWTEGPNGWSPAPHLQGNVNCPDCPLFCQAEKHRDSPGQHQCLRYPPPRKSSCYWSCCYCC